MAYKPLTLKAYEKYRAENDIDELFNTVMKIFPICLVMGAMSWFFGRR